MVAGEVVAAGSGNGLQLVVREGIPEMLSGRSQGVIELIVRVIHLVYLKHIFQASLVERAIMRHKRKPLNPGCNLLPNVREDRCVLGVFFRQSMHLLAEPLIVFRFRIDETVKLVHNLPIAHNNDADAAHAGPALIGRLEIYRRKITHTSASSGQYHWLFHRGTSQERGLLPKGPG